jgi:hypothetical protein
MALQAWDSVQAVCSYLRGILASKAMFEGVGVGDQNATALAATVTWVLRDGASMVGLAAVSTPAVVAKRAARGSAGSLGLGSLASTQTHRHTRRSFASCLLPLSAANAPPPPPMSCTDWLPGVCLVGRPPV